MRFAAGIFAVGGWLLGVLPAPGATTSWSTNASGNFNDPARWTSGAPTNGDTAVFRLGAAASYVVTFPGTGTGGTTPVNYVTNQLRIGTNTVTFADVSAASTYTLGNATTAEIGRGIIVGETASDTAASLTTNLVTFSAAAATLGDAAGSQGVLKVDGGTMNVTGSSAMDEELIVGN